jgi:hypothetical protein
MLATFSLYLDQRKNQLERDIPGSRQWHYNDVPISTTKSYSEYCPQGTRASPQIVQHYGLLSSRSVVLAGPSAHRTTACPPKNPVRPGLCRVFFSRMRAPARIHR